MMRPRLNHSRRHSSTGFTLIELMVTVALIVIIMSFAAPSFSTFQRNSELTSTANTLLSSLTAARAEAMKRGQNVSVVPQDGSDWTKGWIVFVDTDASGTKNGTESALMSEPAVPGTISVATVPSGVVYLMFDGSGYPRLTGGAFQASSLDFSNTSGEARRIVSSPAGRLRVCKPDSSTCAATVF